MTDEHPMSATSAVTSPASRPMNPTGPDEEHAEYGITPRPGTILHADGFRLATCWSCAAKLVAPAGQGWQHLADDDPAESMTAAAARLTR